MTARRWTTAVAVAALLVLVPVVARAAQDAPLGGVQIASFYGPLNCEASTPTVRKLRGPRCTFRPVDATILVIDVSTGRTVARVRTGDDGRGGARLPEGEYELRSGEPHDFRANPPQWKRVTLGAGEVVDAILDYDPLRR